MFVLLLVKNNIERTPTQKVRNLFGSVCKLPSSWPPARVDWGSEPHFLPRSRGSRDSRLSVPKSSNLLLFTILESSCPPPNFTPIFFYALYAELVRVATLPC